MGKPRRRGLSRHAATSLRRAMATCTTSLSAVAEEDHEDEERRRGLPTAAGNGDVRWCGSAMAQRKRSALGRSPMPSNSIGLSAPTPAKVESHHITYHPAVLVGQFGVGAGAVLVRPVKFFEVGGGGKGRGQASGGENEGYFDLLLV